MPDPVRSRARADRALGEDPRTHVTARMAVAILPGHVHLASGADDRGIAPTLFRRLVTEIVELLRGARDGDRDAIDGLFQLAYDELHRLAQQVRRGHAQRNVDTTTLVHEAYLKLLPSTGLPANDRAHFKRLMARAMRQVLIDAARRRLAAKRGGGEITITFDEKLQGGTPMRAAEFLDLARALEELGRVDERRAAVVECRFFGGLDVEETALALGISSATVKRDWRVARAWLAQAIG